MRIALVHDWLTGMRGGERVLEELCQLFPQATLFTLFHHPGSVSSRIEAMPIQTSILNRLAAVSRHYRYWLPLYPWAISRFNLRDFDLIISSSHAVAKGSVKPPGSLHICYCHTPMRYIWETQSDYLRYGDPLRIRRSALRVLGLPLRAWDRETTRRVDHFIANSRNVQERIARCYRRPADVIYPPVFTHFFTPSQDRHPDGFYLIVSALVSFKRLDIAVDAFNQLDRHLGIVGSGPDLGLLRRRAASNIEFRGFVSDEELRELYRQSRCLVVPGREDFGITPLEAQSCARPVVGYAAGGLLESIIDGETGILFDRQSAAGLIDAIRRFEGVRFDPERLRANAERFSTERFHAAIRETVGKTLRTHRASPFDCGLQNADWGLKGLASFNPQSAIRNPQLPDHPSFTGIAGISKRGLDIVISAGALIVFGPLLALTAWIIRRESPGRGFFLQSRIGLRGRTFVMLKLRTMYRDAERADSPIWAVHDDPRCTPLGGFLRRYGLDEVPQLWNVLKGEMSLVGPRPERPEFHRVFVQRMPEFARRLEVRGGLTGLAQIRGWRGDTSVAERLRYDLEYIERWSIWKDIGILLQTPFTLWHRQS